MVIDERQIPVRETVKGACEILGLDPLYVANEGKLLAIVASDSAAIYPPEDARTSSRGVTLKSSEKSSVITPGWC